MKLSSCILILIGSVIQAFGLYHVHSCSGVTEGGVLGLTLLLQQWFEISPAVSGAVLNMICYFIGWKLLGKDFIIYSLVSTAGFCGSYKIIEQFPPLWPELYEMPLLAAVLGALFIGIGVGLCVRVGAAPGGDDALAMSISHVTGVGIEKVYLVSDLLVLGMSISYIPLGRIGFSLLTVILSGQIIGIVQRMKLPWRKKTEK
ncbi:MAG: YitT family protein [Lachnospiraceae bacterium]|nr:YitT family protein [Lachnospiraceae bacterium]